MPWVVFVIPITLIVFGIPLILRRVPPNHIYGFRIPKTLSDERVWYAANYIAGWDMVIAGLAQLLVVGIYPMTPGLQELTASQLVPIAQIPILFIAIGHSFWRVLRM